MLEDPKLSKEPSKTSLTIPSGAKYIRSSRDVLAYILDCDIILSEFEIQSR